MSYHWGYCLLLSFFIVFFIGKVVKGYNTNYKISLPQNMEGLYIKTLVLIYLSNIEDQNFSPSSCSPATFVFLPPKAEQHACSLLCCCCLFVCIVPVASRKGASQSSTVLYCSSSSWHVYIWGESAVLDHWTIFLPIFLKIYFQESLPIYILFPVSLWPFCCCLNIRLLVNIGPADYLPAADSLSASVSLPAADYLPADTDGPETDGPPRKIINLEDRLNFG